MSKFKKTTIHPDLLGKLSKISSSFFIRDCCFLIFYLNENTLHPHLHGEDKIIDISLISLIETPPYTRGRFIADYPECILSRKIYIYTRGRQCTRTKAELSGRTPPYTRGRRADCMKHKANVRNTLIYMGKT